MLSEKNIQDLADACIQIVVKTPQLLFILLSARISGEGWLYLYFTYYKNSETNNNLLNNHIGKLVAGLAWMALVFVPLYFVFNGFHQFQQAPALDMTISLVVYALFIQLIVFIVTVRWKSPR